MISSKNLTDSRFNVDKLIKNKESKLIKKKWVKNFFLKKRGNALHVIEIKNKILGFVLLIFKKNFLIIDLIAIDKKFQNKGLGKKLIDYIEFFYFKRFKKIIVGTQSNNIQSLKFYKKTGFKKIKEDVIFHKHFK